MPRVVIYQGRPCARIPPRHLEPIARLRPGFVCLPEYFWTPASARAHRDAADLDGRAHAAVASLSRELDAVVVGGTVLSPLEGEAEAYRNVCLVYDRGVLAGVQAKVHPTERERQGGVLPAPGFEAIEAGGLRLGVLVCADVLHPGSFARMRELGVDLVFVPTLSPYLRDDTVAAKEQRDREIFAAGARAAGAPVFKACGVGRMLGGRLQGRSLAVDRDGTILVRVPPEEEGRVRVLAVEVSGRRG